MDKQQFNQKNVIAMKQEGRSFPINQDVGVLKWRLQSTDESLMPLTSESLITQSLLAGWVIGSSWPEATSQSPIRSESIFLVQLCIALVWGAS